MTSTGYKVDTFALSDTGHVRQNNEDAWQNLPVLNFYALADGMGGHRAGEIAAWEAVSSLCQILKEKLSLEKNLTIKQAREAIRLAITEVNRHVYSLGQSDVRFKGMGTTLCCVYFHPDGVICAHVGDSRIYRYRQGKLVQMTQDHSLVRELIELGQLSETQAADFLYRNIITRAIGTEQSVDPSFIVSDLQDKDFYLMSTDGLSDQLSILEIEGIIHDAPNLEASVAQLVAAANAKGGYDNTTVVLMQLNMQNPH